MEITVISEEANPMLHRTDVTFRVSHVDATPDRLAVRDSLAARLNKNADEVVIRKLDTKFGMRTTIGEAKVYDGPGFARDVEQDYMLERNKITAGEGEDGDGTVPATESGEADVEPEQPADEEPPTDEETAAEEADAAEADDAETEGEAAEAEEAAGDGDADTADEEADAEAQEAE